MPFSLFQRHGSDFYHPIGLPRIYGDNQFSILIPIRKRRRMCWVRRPRLPQRGIRLVMKLPNNLPIRTLNIFRVDPNIPWVIDFSFCQCSTLQLQFTSCWAASSIWRPPILAFTYVESTCIFPFRRCLRNAEVAALSRIVSCPGEMWLVLEIQIN